MKRPPPLTLATLGNWSKEQLIEYILKKQSCPSLKREKRQKLPQREINFDEYLNGKVAFRIFYVGENYRGLATQLGFKARAELLESDGIPAIEDCLLKAFQELRLIRDRASCDFSRCGRTDTGVSAVHQVIALNVRLSTQKVGSSKEINGSLIDFVKILNKRLPEDIRVLGWQQVSNDFNARFSCKWRQYHYFFPTRNLNLDEMSDATSFLIGEHDFYNLSVNDASKPPGYITVRNIFEAEIVRIDDNFAFLRIKANGFLYHQIRCIMSVLFEIGRSASKSGHLKDLLDRCKIKERPIIPLADPIPLVFSGAEFDPPLDFETEPAGESVSELLRQFLEKKQIDLFLAKLAIGNGQI
jgi:tRNA pseudouridine38/39 synthase